MAGPEAIRGFNFQHARALHAAIDLLEDPLSAVLEVEGDNDVIDYQVIDVHGHRSEVAQIKSRQAPPWWTPGEILNVVDRWMTLADAEQARFLFISDGAPGPDVAKKLLPALEHLRENTLQPEHRAYLKDRKLEDRLGLLRRSRVLLQEPPVTAALEQAELRILRLLQGRRDVTPDEAADIVNRLFREISVMGGGSERRVRRIDRAGVAAVVGVALEDIDTGQEWSTTLAQRLRGQTLGEPEDPVLAEVGLESAEVEVPALRLVGGKSPSSRDLPAERLEELLTERNGAALIGPSGRGKSTALRLVASLAAARGDAPLLVDAGDYRAGSLFRLLRRGLERILETVLTNRATEAWLSSGEAVVLVDGVSERPASEIATLSADLRVLRSNWPDARVLVSGREQHVLARFDLPLYLLQELDLAGQEHIAEALLGAVPGRLTVHRLRQAIGGAIGNPLLLRMGLSLVQAGVEPTSVFGLYEGFIDGLLTRSSTHGSGDGLLAALELCSLDLVTGERFGADGYWWRAQLRAALDGLDGAGVFDTAATSADAALDELVQIGLLVRSRHCGELRYLHDSFRDFFAARALSHGLAPLPEPMDERFEEVAVMLAERNASVELLRRLVDNPVAASAASVHNPRPAGADVVVLTGQLLRQLLATHALPHTAHHAALGVMGWASEERLYVALVPDALQTGTLDSAEAFADGIREAVLVLSLHLDSGPLRIAVTAWQELLRAGLDALAGRVAPVPRPQDPAGLAEAVAEHFVTMREEFEGVAEATCSALTDRLIRESGWRGMVGQVSVTPTPDPLNAGLLHEFRYTYNADIVEVSVGDHDDVDRQGARTFAELYLSVAPRDEALRHLEKTLGRLLPTWGP